MNRMAGKAKWIAAVYIIVAFFCFDVVDAKAYESEVDTSMFEYEENEDGTLSIIDYNGTDETVVIPSEIGGRRVTVIGGWSFFSCDTVKHLSIGEGIVKLGNYSFGDCDNLEIVSLPNTVEIIGDRTFESCKNLREINFSEGLVSIGEYAFENCYKLNNVTLPNSLTTLGKSAFYQCRSLSSIVIPENIKTIENLTFFNCISLQEVKIKEGVETIIGSIFPYCINLKKIFIPNSVKYIHNKAFITGFDASQTMDPVDLIIYANSNSYARTYANRLGIKFSCLSTHDWDKGVITVEPTIKNKGKIAYTCTACGIKKTEILPVSAIPKKGKTISAINSPEVYKVTKSGKKKGTVEFTKSNSIDSADISIPSTVTINGITYKVTSIAKNAFKNNKALKGITINENVTKINANAFKGCSNLKVIKIKSKNLKTVGKNAFKGIHKKAKIKVPSKSLKKYQILLKNKGQKPTVKIIR